jgi:hypothetical protein
MKTFLGLLVGLSVAASASQALAQSNPKLFAAHTGQSANPEKSFNA